MLENVYEKWEDGMSQGDLREPESLKCYRLTRDKLLLEFVYKYKDKIKYVIFVYNQNFGIIKIENIRYFPELSP